MTPEEKAKALVGLFTQEINIFTGGPQFHTNSFAKQCALIAIDEILNDYAIFNEKHKSYKVPSFWQLVKNHIQMI